MQTSRVAREAVKIAKNTELLPRRQTRAFAASVNAFLSDDAPSLVIKEEDLSDESSELSSAASSAAFDIEDGPTIATPRKRKRGVDSPATTVTTTSSVKIATRASPHKAGGSLANGISGRIKKGRRQPAKKEVTEDGEVKIHPPANWEEIYSSVQEMRKKVLAPVDTMGCETLAEDTRSPRDKRFQTLIALMLSSQTKDTTNAIAMRRLQQELPGGFNLESILAVDPVLLNELIWVVGFHNNKTRYIKAAAIILKEQFGGEIPDTIDGLMSLPGVGPKMAYLCMSAAWGRTEGIGVDVHVHRITNLWGWHKTNQPEETRVALEAWLPREKWHEINHLLVGFGQTICLPVGRKCGECTLSTRGLCPGAVAPKKTVVKKVKKEVIKEDSADVKETILKEEEI